MLDVAGTQPGDLAEELRNRIGEDTHSLMNHKPFLTIAAEASMTSDSGEVTQTQIQRPGNKYPSCQSRSSLNSEYSTLESSSRLSAIQLTTALHHQEVASGVCSNLRIESLIVFGMSLVSLINCVRTLIMKRFPSLGPSSCFNHAIDTN